MSSSSWILCPKFREDRKPSLAIPTARSPKKFDSLGMFLKCALLTDYPLKDYLKLASDGALEVQKFFANKFCGSLKS